MKWKGLLGAATLAALACGSAAFASDDTLQAAASMGGSQMNPLLLDDTTAPSTAPATTPASTSPPPTPIMLLIGPTGFGNWLTTNNFNITGFVEGGYFIDTNNPRLGAGPNGDSPTFVNFPGAYSNRVLLDQLDFTLSRSVDTTKEIDWGFTFENGYGTDDSYIHSHGLLDNRPPNDPQNQYDIVQANLQLFLKVGNGLTITAGKFVALLGQEVINPTGNVFFTHSYSFFYAIPATNTGATASYTFPKLIGGNDWTAIAGFTEGFNQSLRNNNGDIDFLGEFKGNITTALSIVTNIEWGPQGTNDSSDYWTVVEAIPTLKVSDQLTVLADCVYGDAPHSATTTPGASAQWYGVCGYAGYTINPMFTLNCRAEWYRDQGASPIGPGTQANYYELTLGTQIHPLPNDKIFQFLQIRPEIRGDFADRRVYDASNSAGGEYSELTCAVDVIMQF